MAVKEIATTESGDEPMSTQPLIRQHPLEHATVPQRDSYQLLSPEPPPQVTSHEFNRRMDQVGRCLRENDVAAIYLIHGTFVGHDPFGTYVGLADVLPNVSNWLARLTKNAIDQVLDDVANYSDEYASSFQRSICQTGEPSIPVRRFVWTGENNHLGRAAAAVRLIDTLAAADIPAGKRVLLWGHSHGGNVLALLTNLLEMDRQRLDRFFDATRIYYSGGTSLGAQRHVWQRVHRMLAGNRQNDHAPALFRRHQQNSHQVDHGDTGVLLDMVTFGMPIRYGWEPLGFDNLLHFVNHHPTPGVPPYLSAPPNDAMEVIRGQHGDYVQLAGIHGTNIAPMPWCWRAFTADRQLGALLAPGEHWYHLARRMRAGNRVPHEGITLLVDYGAEPSRWIRHLAGHSVYTRTEWLPFHAEQVVREFYEAPSAR